MIFGGIFEVDQKIKYVIELEKQTTNANFWDDKENAILITNTIKEKKILIKEITDLKETIEYLIEFSNEDISQLVNETKELELKVKEFEIKILLNEENDSLNCIFEIHSGAGGTEACDWANMLYRMYIKFLETNKYKYEILDLQKEDIGIKKAILLIKKQNAYGYLKSEKGVHRLVRISPFDANKKRHTSFASIDVIPEIENPEIEIVETDLKIDVYRSGGAGGQSVNTTDSAVRITHLPTGIIVTCQNERSQIKNKETAIKVLKNKLYIYSLEKHQEEIKKIQGTKSNIEFGSQIRSYVIEPYTLVKDHRTNIEKTDVERVLDGDINDFIFGFLKNKR